MTFSRSRKISAVALFSALAIVLNLTVKVPAPYAPFLIYQLWEVPIFAGFLIFGSEVGILTAALNLVILQAIAPGPLPTGPLYNLAAIFATMLGMAPVHRLLVRAKRGGLVVAAGTTLSGTASRLLIMTVVNGLLLPFGYPIGFNIPPDALPGLLGLIAVFNATLALYTIPLAYGVLKAVRTRFGLTPVYDVASAQPNEGAI